MRIQKLKLTIAEWLMLLAEWLMRDMPKKAQNIIPVEKFDLNTMHTIVTLPKHMNEEEAKYRLCLQIAKALEDKIQVEKNYIDRHYCKWTATLIWARKKQPF